MNILQLSNQKTIKSTELVDIINDFREQEGNPIKLSHDNFMKKIKKELETLISLGLRGRVNFYESSYINSQNKKQPCFELNRDGMLEMLNSESAFVRYKTIEYINKLEEKIKQPKDSYLIDDRIERAEAWIREQKAIKGLQADSKYLNEILNNPSLVTITQIAKDYGMSGKKLNDTLHQLKIQYKQNGQWLLYSSYQDKGYTHSKTIAFKHSDDRPDTKMITEWTQAGRKFLYEMLKSINILPLIEKYGEQIPISNSKNIQA